MKGKILLVAGFGVGYVLGAKAGRERYESIKRLTDKFWHSRGVQKQVHHAEEYVKAKTPDVVGFAASGVKKVVTRRSDVKKASTARPVPKTSTPGSPDARS